MCGIVGYIGEEQAAPILLKGLEKLEYRGYDSAGVALYNGGHLQVAKAKGRLKVLSELIEGGQKTPGTLGIGHTRWATHGAPSDINSHPQVSDSGKFAWYSVITKHDVRAAACRQYVSMASGALPCRSRDRKSVV